MNQRTIEIHNQAGETVFLQYKYTDKGSNEIKTAHTSDPQKIAEILAERPAENFEQIRLTGDEKFHIVTKEEDQRFYISFPKENLTMSYGSNYGGNVLFGKKFEGLRLASWQAVHAWPQKVQMAEHMALLEVEYIPTGEKKYIAYAAPSNSGKTNFAMIKVPAVFKGIYRIKPISDDLLKMVARPVLLNSDGTIKRVLKQPTQNSKWRLYAVNPEGGMFGVVTDTNPDTNPNFWHAITKPGLRKIFTNMAYNDQTQEIYWKGNPNLPWLKIKNNLAESIKGWRDWTHKLITDRKVTADVLHNLLLTKKAQRKLAELKKRRDAGKSLSYEENVFLGMEGKSLRELNKEEIAYAQIHMATWEHPNGRATVSATNVPNLSEKFNDPIGVPVDAIAFGGRVEQEGLVPKVREIPDVNIAIHQLMTMFVQKTAAETGPGGVTYDPAAMRPFFSNPEFPYMQHWKDVADFVGDGFPAMFQVNWFAKDTETGEIIAPWFADNVRVIDWMFRMMNGTAHYEATPYGNLPTTSEEGIILQGLHLTPEEFERVRTYNRQGVLEQAKEARKFLESLETSYHKVPQFLLDANTRLINDLENDKAMVAHQQQPDAETLKQLQEKVEAYPRIVTGRAAAELTYLGLRGAYQEVTDIVANKETPIEEKISHLRDTFQRLKETTANKEEIVAAYDMLKRRNPYAEIPPAELKQLKVAIKDTADAFAKRIFEQTAKQEGIILMVRVSEGFGRDGVEESLKSNEVILPPELARETAAIQKAIDHSAEYYYSAQQKKFYPVADMIVDVIEGTNQFVTNSGNKTLENVSRHESGATNVAVFSQGKGILRKMGNAPDGYVGQFFTNLGSAKEYFLAQTYTTKDGTKFSLSDPELYAREPQAILAYFKFLAEIRKQKLSDLKEEIVLMNRDREAALIAAISKIKAEYNIAGITIAGAEGKGIADGTVPQALKAVLTPELYKEATGNSYGMHKTVITVGGSAEGFMNLAVAAALADTGAVGRLRVYSAQMNKNSAGEKVKDMSERYAFSDKEWREMRDLRAPYKDAGAILAGKKYFDAQDFQGDINGYFAFNSTNGVFERMGTRQEGSDFVTDLLHIQRKGDKRTVEMVEDRLALQDLKSPVSLGTDEDSVRVLRKKELMIRIETILKQFRAGHPKYGTSGKNRRILVRVNEARLHFAAHVADNIISQKVAEFVEGFYPPEAYSRVNIEMGKMGDAAMLDLSAQDVKILTRNFGLIQTELERAAFAKDRSAMRSRVEGVIREIYGPKGEGLIDPFTDGFLAGKSVETIVNGIDAAMADSQYETAVLDTAQKFKKPFTMGELMLALGTTVVPSYNLVVKAHLQEILEKNGYHPEEEGSNFYYYRDQAMNAAAMTAQNEMRLERKPNEVTFQVADGTAYRFSYDPAAEVLFFGQTPAQISFPAGGSVSDPKGVLFARINTLKKDEYPVMKAFYDRFFAEAYPGAAGSDAAMTTAGINYSEMPYVQFALEHIGVFTIQEAYEEVVDRDVRLTTLTALFDRLTKEGYFTKVGENQWMVNSDKRDALRKMAGLVSKMPINNSGLFNTLGKSGQGKDAAMGAQKDIRADMAMFETPEQREELIKVIDGLLEKFSNSIPVVHTGGKLAQNFNLYTMLGLNVGQDSIHNGAISETHKRLINLLAAKFNLRINKDDYNYVLVDKGPLKKYLRSSSYWKEKGEEIHLFLFDLKRRLQEANMRESQSAGEDVKDADAAMNADFTKGGIDLDPNLFEIKTKGDSGLTFPRLKPGAVPTINGLTPAIINVVPVTNLPLLLGLADTGTKYGLYPKKGPLERKARAEAAEGEQLSLLN